MKTTLTAAPPFVERPAAPLSNSDEPERAFHVNPAPDQSVERLITGNIKALIRSRASRKGWATRKRLAAVRRTQGSER